MARWGIWIKLYADVAQHPKLIEFCTIMGYPPYKGLGIIAHLWLWWAQYVPGEFHRTSALLQVLDMIGADPVDHDNIILALCKAGFFRLDPQNSEVIIMENWEEHLGALALAREKDRSRKTPKKASTSDGTPTEFRRSSSHKEGDQEVEVEKEKDLPPPPPPADFSSSPASLLASTFRNSGGKPLSHAKAVEHIQAALSVGVKGSVIEFAFMAPQNRGKAIWDVLEPLREAAQKQKALQQRPVQKSVKCSVCNDSGLTAGGAENGKVSMIPCSCKREKSSAAS